MSSANRKLVMVRPAMLIVPLCSSSTSDIILSRKMLKRVGDNMHPWRTPTVVWNQSPMLPLMKTALIARSAYYMNQVVADVILSHDRP